MTIANFLIGFGILVVVALAWIAFEIRRAVPDPEDEVYFKDGEFHKR